MSGPVGVVGAIAVEAAEMIFEHGMAKNDTEAHKENMVIVFDSATEMYEKLLEGELSRRERKEIEKTLNRISILKSIYTGDTSHVRWIGEDPNFWQRRAKSIYEFTAKKISERAQFILKEMVDIVPLVSAGTVDEALHTVAIGIMSKIHNNHPEVSDDEKIRYNLGMLKGTVKATVTEVKDYAKGLTAEEAIKILFGKKKKDKKKK